jgi:hypothetical protein
MNLFVLFDDGAVARKMMETLHHALRAMVKLLEIFVPGGIPSPNQKKKNIHFLTLTKQATFDRL